jgi:integrase
VRARFIENTCKATESGDDAARLLAFLKDSDSVTLTLSSLEVGDKKPSIVPTPTSASADKRRWLRAELMGSHSHATNCGADVHVWKRGEAFIARGFFGGQRYAETLGSTTTQATTRLRQLLTEIEDGSYVRPKEAHQRLISRGKVPRLNVRQLIDEFLAEKQNTCGEQTAGDYRSRLGHVLDFAEQQANRQRWPLAMNIDRNFVVELRAALMQKKTTRNGKSGGEARPVSGRLVINALQTLNMALSWAARADVRKLPADWVNPVTKNLIGKPPAKDPYRLDPLPLASRIRLVQHMDPWQLCQLALSVVLPLRPDEAAGLLIADVDFDHDWLLFGANLSDVNFTKERLAFRLPFPPQLRPVLVRCIGDRKEGALLRDRKAFVRAPDAQSAVASLTDLADRFNDKLLRQRPGKIKQDHDRKRLFRRFLRELGGVSEDMMGKAFKQVASAAGLASNLTLYALRKATTTTMKQDAKLDLLELRYLTSHSTSDIMHHYTPLDIKGAMGRYFAVIQPLLDVIAAHAVRLGIS